jgi:AcrR family transcriptional regulator
VAKAEQPDQSRLPLTRERILEAALHLADEDGIEALSMRTLARELGVKAMSLYNHIANKGDLVDAMADLVVGEIDLPDDEERWEVAIRRCAVSAHAVFLRHPWACGLVMAPSSTDAAQAARLRYMDWLLGRLRRAGFSAELAYHAYHALDAHVLGFTMWQLGHSAGLKQALAGGDLAALAADFIRTMGAEYPHLAEHAEKHLEAPTGDGDREFAFGLDLILEGLERARGGDRDSS